MSEFCIMKYANNTRSHITHTLVIEMLTKRFINSIFHTKYKKLNISRIK